MLTSKQRAFLRGLANPLPATQQIGKDGVTEAVNSRRELFGEAQTDYLRAAELDRRKNEIEEELLSLYEIVM